MTSLKQIEANRRNALKSTGPRTEEGKHNASRNAIRHGLTADTVVEPLEDTEDYKAFEQAVAADYDAQSAVERELILRLASLLWRLRRATSIETGLMSIEDEVASERERRPESPSTARDSALTALIRLGKRATRDARDDRGENSHAFQNETGAHGDGNAVSRLPAFQGDVARRFLRVANLDNGVFERLSRYEMALWRQIRQTLFTLEAMRWSSLAARHPNQNFWRTRRDI